MKEVIATDKAPAAIGAYSQAIKANGFIFVSGQLPIDPATSAFSGLDGKSQAVQSLKNIQAILEKAGSSMDRVVKTTIYLKNIDDFSAVNEEYSKFFTENPPARAAFAVADLPKGALIEIEAIALT